MRHHGSDELGEVAASRLRGIARELQGAEVPYDDWVLLYTNLHRLERAVFGGPEIANSTNEEERPRMRQPESEPSTAALVKEAIDEAKQLIHLATAVAVALARRQLRRLQTGGPLPAYELPP